MIDISLPLVDPSPSWPGHPPFRRIPVKRLATGDDTEVSEIRMSTHWGTHIDAPSHTVRGAASTESVSINVLVGPASVVDFTDVENQITASALESRVTKLPTRLLLKTRNSLNPGIGGIRFPDEYISLSVDAARWMAGRGVALVGTDFLSIEKPGDASKPVHRTLFEAGVAVLEGLSLHRVTPGEYLLICLPLRLMGSDGAPARAMLLRRGATRSWSDLLG